jgi:hypothetical protein
MNTKNYYQMKLQLFIVMLLCSGYGLKAQDVEPNVINVSPKEKKRISLFEKSFAATLSSNKKEIKLIAFMTLPLIEPEEREKFKDAARNHPDEENDKIKMYIAEDSSFCRVYFPYYKGDIDYNGVQYTANEKGIVSIPGKVNIGKIKFITDSRQGNGTVHSTGNNTIDSILFRIEIKQDGIHRYSHPKDRICLFTAELFTYSKTKIKTIPNGVSEPPVFDEKISLFEKNYAASLSSDQNEIKLIGFVTIPIKEENREKLKDLVKNHADEINNNMYFADDYSFCRTYYMLQTAIVDYNGAQYTANKNGTVSIPESVDISKIKVIGRERSTYTRHLKEELKQDGITGYSHDGICVFATTQLQSKSLK